MHDARLGILEPMSEIGAAMSRDVEGLLRELVPNLTNAPVCVRTKPANLPLTHESQGSRKTV